VVVLGDVDALNAVVGVDFAGFSFYRVTRVLNFELVVVFGVFVYLWQKSKRIMGLSSEIRVLNDVVVRRGFRYVLVKRVGDVAMYEQHDIKLGMLVGYEVFVVKVLGGSWVKFPGQSEKQWVEPYEAFPHDEAFGLYAYAPSTLEHANRRFEQLLERVESRKMKQGVREDGSGEFRSGSE
jgi:hypothetical protein